MTTAQALILETTLLVFSAWQAIDRGQRGDMFWMKMWLFNVTVCAALIILILMG